MNAIALRSDAPGRKPAELRWVFDQSEVHRAAWNETVLTRFLQEAGIDIPGNAVSAIYRFLQRRCTMAQFEAHIDSVVPAHQVAVFWNIAAPALIEEAAFRRRPLIAVALLERGHNGVRYLEGSLVAQPERGLEGDLVVENVRLPVHALARHGHADAIEAFVKRHGPCQLHARFIGCTPLHLAIRHEKIDCAKRILDLDPSTVDDLCLGFMGIAQTFEHFRKDKAGGLQEILAHRATFLRKAAGC